MFLRMFYFYFCNSLRTALAMGADRGIHIETNLRTDQELQPLAVAKALKYIVEVINY